MLRRFGLEELRDQHPFLLSGGQKRRLSVGTALIAGAPVLALDEPTFGQDRERAAELLDMLRDLNDEGTTVLVVTHDLQLVAEYANRVVVMRDGRILGVGPTAEVLAGPLIERGRAASPAARAGDARPREPPRMACGDPDVATARPRPRLRHERPTARTRAHGPPLRAARPVRRATRAHGGVRFLHALNPLAKLAAPLPVMVALVFTRGFAIPLTFIVLAAALLLIGARLSPRGARRSLLGAADRACSCSA